MFITFEGGDGAGKSTQITLLCDTLRKNGHTVLQTREPGGSQGAEEIRGLLVTGDSKRWSVETEALLMFAARRDHLEKTILPALARGEIVICDRFVDSSMAYQGIAGDVGKDFVAALSELVVGANQPDITIILDIDTDQGLARATTDNGEGRFESKGSDYQKAVRQAFLDIAAVNNDRCVVIDANGSIEIIRKQILDHLGARAPELFHGS